MEICDKQVLLAGATMRRIVTSVTNAATICFVTSDAGKIVGAIAEAGYTPVLQQA